MKEFTDLTSINIFSEKYKTKLVMFIQSDRIQNFFIMALFTCVYKNQLSEMTQKIHWKSKRVWQKISKVIRRRKTLLGTKKKECLTANI